MQFLGAGESALQRFPAEMLFCGLFQVVVPDVGKGVIETDTFKAVIQANGPALLGGARGKQRLGEVLEAVDPGELFRTAGFLVALQNKPPLL